MDIAALLLVLAELALGCVLALAATTKVIDQRRWAQALRDYRIAALRAPVVRWGVPVIEAVVAIALLAHVEPLAAGAALLLCLAFATVLVIAMLRGAESDCQCFGELLPSRIGPPAIYRAAALAALAAAIVGLGLEHPATEWLVPVPARIGLLAAVMLVGLWGAGRRTPALN